MKNIYIQMLDIHPVDPNLVLATVTQCKGSTPQKPGSSALFSKNGLICGTVGGGILEAKVQDISLSALSSKEPQHPTFFLNKDISNGEDAICGGQISVLIEPEPFKYLSVFSDLKKSIEDKIPGILITMVTGSSGSDVFTRRFWLTENSKPEMPAHLIAPLEPVVKSILDKCDPYDFREIEIKNPGEDQISIFFLEPVIPPPSLIIAGAGHIGKALANLGSLLGFEVTVLDDRDEYANRSNFPGSEKIIVGDIGSGMNMLSKNSDTYIVIVTRGHKDDERALKACIGSDAAYIGMIGSKNKVSVMRTNFIVNRWANEEQWSKIHAPVGIDICSRSVEEIAISIAAQMIKVKNCKRQKQDNL
jgi:xanthine dehydrogenase accessory factor